MRERLAPRSDDDDVDMSSLLFVMSSGSRGRTLVKEGNGIRERTCRVQVNREWMMMRRMTFHDTPPRPLFRDRARRYRRCEGDAGMTGRPFILKKFGIYMDIVAYFLCALGCSLSASVLNVFLAWVVLFRQAGFRQQVSALEKKRQQLEDMKAKVEDDDKSTAKRLKRLEDDIAAISKDIASKNMRFTVTSGVVLFVMNRLFRSGFNGLVVARIPFEPLSLATRLTHSSIENEDMRDGSFQFVYWMGSLLFRDVLTKLFNFQVPQVSMAEQAMAMQK